VLALLLLGVPVAAEAADPADREHGRTIARTWCASCHAVERREDRQRSDTPPSFVILANDPRNTTERLRAFLTRPHGRMPDFNLSRQDREDLIAYLLSLREGRATPAPTAPGQRLP
jgi:mono/diheme cytochrome c family protein